MYTGCDIKLVSLLHSGMLLDTQILFNPFKLAFLIAWVYLCMYSVQRLESSPLVPLHYKPIANIFSLLIGPFLLFVLFTADRAKKMEEGTLKFKDILKDLFSSIFQSNKTIAAGNLKIKPIELLDSSGKSFFEVYGMRDDNQESGKAILYLTEKMILDAIQQKASDILIDPKRDGSYIVRFRVDGFLATVNEIERDVCLSVVNVIKIISGMDIAERRRPQDGAFMARIPEGNVFFRVASAGVLGGEKLSLRVLNQSAGLLDLEDTGISRSACLKIDDILKQSSGMVLICGPTGSGKTTSLYAMLGNIDFCVRNVITVEDPVEYVLANASQIEINPKADITFANALRGILRQDPDVICVGEIRDAETAAMALQASQTGHLVLATLHSSSNTGALVRLMDLGIKPLLLASALSVIISQRLVRRLCDYCKNPADFSDRRVRQFEEKRINPQNIMQANGCKKCHGTGYSGRTGIFDVMYLDRQIKAKLAGGKLLLDDLKKQGGEKGISTLRTEAMKKVLAGITTLEEMKRIISSLG